MRGPRVAPNNLTPECPSDDKSTVHPSETFLIPRVNKNPSVTITKSTNPLSSGPESHHPNVSLGTWWRIWRDEGVKQSAFKPSPAPLVHVGCAACLQAGADGPPFPVLSHPCSTSSGKVKRLVPDVLLRISASQPAAKWDVMVLPFVSPALGFLLYHPRWTDHAARIQ